MLSLRNRGAGTLLLKEEPRETKQYPIAIGQQECILVDESVSSEGDQNRKIERQSDDVTPWSSVRTPRDRERQDRWQNEER